MNVEYVTLSDAEQKEEAIRAIVTAQHEIDALCDENITNRVGDYALADIKRAKACEWLSLCK